MADKIFIVETSRGSFEDYSQKIETAFHKREDAEKFVRDYNIALELKRVNVIKCCDCFIAFIDCSSIKDKDKFKKKILKKCKKASLLFSEEDITCLNDKRSEFYEISEEYDAEIKGIDVY